MLHHLFLRVRLLLINFHHVRRNCNEKSNTKTDDTMSTATTKTRSRSPPSRPRYRRRRKSRAFVVQILCLLLLSLSLLRVCDAKHNEWVAPDGDVVVVTEEEEEEEENASFKNAKEKSRYDDPSTLSQLFDWAIENSDRDKLRAMAKAMKTREEEEEEDETGDEGNERRNWRSEELLEKAKNVRAMLDQMAMHPSEVEILKEITEKFTDGSVDVRERVRALERLDEMVAQIDLAFDFHTILGLKPLLMVVENESEVNEVRAQACQVFATLTSNYEKIQEIAADEFNAVSVLLNATSLAFEKKDETVAKKCLFALTSLTRNVKRLRSEYLFNGDDVMRGKLSHAKYLFKSSLMAPKSVIGDAVWTRTANFLSDIVINAKHRDYNNDEETQLMANLFKDDWTAIEKAAIQVKLRFNSPNASEREASANLALAMIDSKDDAFRNAFKSIDFEIDLISYDGKYPNDSNEFKHLVRDIQRAFKKNTHEEL